jgi:ectoine hydroxylase-related dioxygenase (phytanoyl-CoA dioxygenase family)
VWIALDDVHADAGPFQFVPGSHRWPLLRQQKVKRRMKPEEVNTPHWPTLSEKVIEPLFEEKFRRHGLTPTDFMARKGDVLIWHGRLAHQGSHALNSSLERRSLIAHYTERQHHLCSGTPESRHARQRPAAGGGLYYNYSTRPS